MSALKIMFFILLTFQFYCKSGPVVKPKTQGNNSVLVLVAEINKPLDFNVYSRKTYPVKLADNQYLQQKVIESDYSAGFSETRNYFFNLEPGKYTVIAVNYTARGGNGMFKPYTVLDEQSVKGLIFEITEGEVKVFGHLKILIILKTEKMKLNLQ